MTFKWLAFSIHHTYLYRDISQKFCWSDIVYTIAPPPQEGGSIMYIEGAPPAGNPAVYPAGRVTII